MSFDSPIHRELHNLLAVRTERPLTAWEDDRLWEILEAHPELVEDFVAANQVHALLESLSRDDLLGAGIELPVTNVIPIEPEADIAAVSSPARHTAAWMGIAATFAAAAVGIGFLLRTESSPFIDASIHASVSETSPGQRPTAYQPGVKPQVTVTNNETRAESPAHPNGQASPTQSTAPKSAGTSRSHPNKTPEQQYRELLATTSPSGSLNRPPTQFTSLTAGAGPATPGKVGFNKDIRPILSEYCFHCHGPDSASRKADLRLDTREGALGQDVLIPGDPEASELVTRVFHTDEDEMMPPPESHKVMKPQEKALLKRWIAQGAQWEDHWAFIPPRRPDPSKSDDSLKWARNDLDHFVFARMTEAGLTPNEEADRYTLARRLAIDITGLPPTPAEIEAFVNDGSATAYEDYVTRLLERPAHGEHMARFWLDAARYGDTHGMHLDNYREIWPYRDWVINAYNHNMPFDQFALEQIAGDLIPDRTLDQQIATGFSRCNVTSSEGGSIPEELAARYMVDRVETTSTVFLGLTAGCAACHDHKFDPISQKEFYSLAAFFNNTTQPAMDGNRKDTPPVAVVPGEKDRAAWEELRQAEQKAEQAIARARKEAGKAFAAWKTADLKTESLDQPIDAEGLELWLPLNEGKGDWVAGTVRGEARSFPVPPKTAWEKQDEVENALAFHDMKTSLAVPGVADFDTGDTFTIAAWVHVPKATDNFTILSRQETKGDKRGWTLDINQRRLAFQMIHKGGDLLDFQAPDQPVTPGKWHHIVFTYSGANAPEGGRFYVDGKLKELRFSNRKVASGTTRPEKPIDLMIGGNGSKGLEGGAVRDVRLYDRFILAREAEALAAASLVQRDLAAGKTPDKKWDQALLTHYLITHDGEDRPYAALQAGLAKTTAEQDAIMVRSPTTLVMQENPNEEARAWILKRGEYDQKTGEVRPGVPGAIMPFPEDAPQNRMGLARWLIEPEHPLTARVTVNRLWQQFFGTGLVKTSEDFGVMGERPSHPELLDWLAREFQASGWDTRHMIRLIVNSATYRQSGAVGSHHREIDPANRLLARGPRVRLDAEVLRDQALFTSGLLVKEVGGPSVKPYQPGGIWEAVAFVGSNTQNFKQDTGDALYRRSLYTFWKRTAAPPTMSIFDAPSRENCTVRRERTNTPLQALVLMNDPQYVEAARALAESTLKNPDASIESRIADITYRVTGRPVSPEDRALLVTALEQFSARFQEAPDSAKQLIETGDSTPDPDIDTIELAAWTMVANTLLNRDDVISKN